MNLVLIILLILGIIYAASSLENKADRPKAPAIRNIGALWDYIESLHNRLGSDGVPVNLRSEYKGETILRSSADAKSRAESYLAEYKSSHRVINYTVLPAEEFTPYWENPLCKRYYAADYVVYYETGVEMTGDNQDTIRGGIVSADSTMILCDNGQIVVVKPA